jgi:hypothetical protein
MIRRENLTITHKAKIWNTKVTNEKSRHCETEGGRGSGGSEKDTYVELHS